MKRWFLIFFAIPINASEAPKPIVRSPGYLSLSTGMAEDTSAQEPIFKRGLQPGHEEYPHSYTLFETIAENKAFMENDQKTMYPMIRSVHKHFATAVRADKSTFDTIEKLISAAVKAVEPHEKENLKHAINMTLAHSRKIIVRLASIDPVFKKTLEE